MPKQYQVYIMSLNQKQALAVQSLLTGASISAVAEAVGVHRCTVHQWLRKPEFQAVVEQAQLTHKLLIEDQIQEMAGSALQVIRQSIEDESLPMALRLRAALAVVKQATSVRPAALPAISEAEADFDLPEATVPDSDSIDDLSPIPNMAEIIANPIRPLKPLPPQPAVSNKIPRNAKCPCGSGLKFKRCCNGKSIAA